MPFKKTISTIFILFLCSSGFCALENFTTYTSDGSETITSTRVTWTLATPRSVTYSVYKDYGVGHFDQYNHLLTVDFSVMTKVASPPEVNCWMVSNQTGDAKSAEVAGNGQIVGGYDTSPNTNIYIEEASTKASSAGYVITVSTTPYYLTITRVGTTASCKIYSDSGRTTLLDTESVTCSTTTFRYLNVFNGYNDGSLNTTATGYSDSLNLQEGVVTSTTKNLATLGVG